MSFTLDIDAGSMTARRLKSFDRRRLGPSPATGWARFRKEPTMMKPIARSAVLILGTMLLCEPTLAAEPKPVEVPSPNRKLDVWYVPTTTEVVDRMLDIANVGPLDVVYDLGCGDGRI